MVPRSILPQGKLKKNDATVFISFLILLSILKLWLINSEEILASCEGYDMAWHILAANRNVWLGDNYNLFTFIHLPVSPLWISLVHYVGIPLRTAVELAFLASGLYFIHALRMAGISRFICVVCFTLTIFNPWTFRLFNLTLAEIPYTFLLLAAVSAAILVFVHRNDKGCLLHSILFGIWCALLWNLRKENILIILFILLLSMICAWLMIRQTVPWKTILLKLSTVALVPIILILVVTITFLSLNYWKWGLFAMTELSSPGYTAAYKSLLRIKPIKQVHYASVTSDVRQAAYGVSPAFSRLRPYLESPLNNFAIETERVLGIQNEIASGWFYWALREAAAASGHLASAQSGNAFFKQISDEIEHAIEDGRLEGRFTPFTFLDPHFLTYLPNMPDSFLKIVSQFRERQELKTMIDDSPPELVQIYNKMASRRPIAAPDKFAASLQRFIWKVHGRIIDGFIVLAFAAAVFLLLSRRLLNIREPMLVVLTLIGFVVFSRIGLFSLLDASSWPANQPRYMLPIMPLFSSSLVLLINQAWISGQLLLSSPKFSVRDYDN